MIALFYYLITVVVCSGILYSYYHFALRNKVFHAWNRFYLLAMIPFSILLPLLDINIIAPADNGTKIVSAMRIVAGADEYGIETDRNAGISWSAELITFLVYSAVALGIAIVFTIGLVKLLRMINKYKPVLLENFYFLNTNEPGTPFSFFRYLVWNSEIPLDTENGKRILEHELVHIREKHSLDKIFIHFTLIFFWVNPFFWLVRQEMTMIHEFIADRKAVGSGDSEAFAKLILAASFPNHTSFLTQSFFQSSIKRRLAMISKKNNPLVAYVSRLMMIPVVFIMVFAFAVQSEPKNNEFTPPPAKLEQKFIVVVDAGHGGDDAGAISEGVKEKELSLKLARLIKEMNANSNIEVVLTRSQDQSTALTDRVKTASDKNAQLFLSLHVGASPGADQKGITAFISGRDLSRQEQNVRFASILLNNLSGIYTVDNNIRKRENQGIWVLDKNVCPAVLLECGYISNADDKKYISSKANQEKIAHEILRSIEDYFSKTVLIQPSSPVIRPVNDTTPKANAKDKTGTPAPVEVVVQGHPLNKIESQNQPVVVQGQPLNKIESQSQPVVVQGYPLNKAADPNKEVAVQGYAKKKDDGTLKYFVDGKEVNAAVANSINPDNIASVNVNKSPSGNTINIVTKQVNASNKASNKLTLNKTTPPLFILNGDEISEEEMEMIDPNKIESINVLKDKSAETKYGEKGKNGVIEITLKKKQG